MQALETGLFALSLLMVPGLAWFGGRALGRRNRPIGAVLVLAGFVPMLVSGARFAALAFADGSTLAAKPRPFTDAFGDRVSTAAATPGTALFFVAVAALIAMLGWAATPVAAPRTTLDSSP